jgi:hypothetical protein
MARLGRPKAELVVTDVERAELMRLTKRARVNRDLAFRAKLILACDEEPSNTTVAQRLRTTNQTCHSPGGWGQLSPGSWGQVTGIEDRPI